MINRVLFTLWAVVSSLILFGQSDEVPQDFDYNYIIRQLESEMEILESDSTQDDESVKLERFRNFWEDRVPANGDMREYPKIMSRLQFASNSKNGTNSTCQTGCDNCCVQSNWNYFGPTFLNVNKIQNLGKVGALWVSPANPDFILAGADSGLWKTTDGGVNWLSLTESCFPSIGIQSIAVHPTDLNTMYIGTGYRFGVSHSLHSYGYGIYKTTDGGVSWHQLSIGYGSPENGIVTKIIVHPTIYSNIYATVGYKVYKSIDNGLTWGEVFGDTENINKLPLYDLEIIVNGLQDDIYVSSYDKRKDYMCLTPPLPGTYNWGNPFGGYCETRFTASLWRFESTQNSILSTGNTLLNPSLPNYNPVTKLSSISITNNSVNIACQTNFDASPLSPPAEIKVYRKLIASTNWSLLGTSLSNGVNYGFSFPFDVSSSNEDIMYYGGYGLNKSTNNAVTFSQMHGYWDFWFNSNGPAAGMHPDLRSNGSLIYSSSNNGNTDVLYWGNDGGISNSLDGGVTTHNLNGIGLQLTQFNGISNSEILPNLIYGGTQDNGAFDNSNQEWRNYPFGDGYDAVSDPVNPLVAYMTMNSSSLRRTINGGATWSSLGAPSGERLNNAALYIETNGNSLFVGKNNLWKYTGSAWSQVSSFNSPSGKIVDIDMSDNGVVKYIAYSGPVYGSANRGKKVYKFDNSGCINGCDLSTNLPGIDWAGITDIATDNSGDNLWISFGGMWSADKKVYHYHSGVWTEFGQGLNNIPANSIEYYKDDILFVGTDDGVYYRDGNASSWSKFNCNMPQTIISDLEVNYTSNKLRASTYSKGVWETSINYNLGNNSLSCSSNPIVSAKITPSFFISYYPSLQVNQVVKVGSKSSTITISASDVCDGKSCCESSDGIKWNVYKDNVLYTQGAGETFSFSGVFRVGFLFFRKRHSYRVEASFNCGGSDCDTKNYYFEG